MGGTAGGGGYVQNLSPRSWSFTQLAVGAGGFLRSIDLVSDGTKVVRADTYGAYVFNTSTNKWQQLVTTTSMPNSVIGAPLTNDGVYEVRIAPSNTSIIYMTYLNQVFKSTDRGLTFSLTGFSAQTLSPNNNVAQYGPKMAIDPVNANVVYLVTDAAGAFVTVNGGTSWSSVATVANNDGTNLGVVAFDAASGTTGGKTNTIYIGSSGTGLYRSTNAGGSWTLLTSTPTLCSRVKVNSDSAAYVISGTVNTGSQKLWKLVGTTWTDITSSGTASQGGPDNVLLDPANVSHITSFLPSGYLDDSTNKGGTWTGVNFNKTRVTSDIPYLGTINPSITSGSQSSFYFGIGDIVTDSNTGTTWMTGGQAVFTTGTIQPTTNQVWTSNAAGVEQLVSQQIMSAPGQCPLLISWDIAALKSTNPNNYITVQSWDTTRSINRGFWADYASNNPQFVAAIVNTNAEESGFSNDGGLSFTKFSAAPIDFNINPGGAIACASSTNMVWQPSDDGDMYYTNNGGTSWNKITIAGVPAAPSETGWGHNAGLRHVTIAADRINIGTFYAYNYGPSAASSAKGVYKSTDGGVIWTHVFTNWLTNIGSSGDSFFNSHLRAVPGNAGNLFFTGGPQSPGPWPHTQSFWRSTDAGSTWNAVANVLEVWDFGFGAPAPGGTYPSIFIYGWVNSIVGVWLSTDNCSTWTQLSDIHPSGWCDEIVAVSGDINNPDLCYLGTIGSGFIAGRHQ